MKKIVPVIMAAFVLILLGTQLSFAQTRPPIIPGDSGSLVIPHASDPSQPPEQYFGGVLLPTITRTV
ncbi:MAG TPA: hypothetical protein VI588_01195, partial [Candidatus Gracilibacteria bacterium]|nr:hypothetical protein [Candidatus Gracilibacteria bacterium]